MLEVRHLVKSFDGKTNVLDDISFSIAKGEVVVVIGPSGCGKSTFLRCLNKLEPIQAGEILLDGVLITREGIKEGSNSKKKDNEKVNYEVRQKVGMVFQSYELFPNMTIIENVTLAPVIVQKRDKEEVIKEAEKLLKRVGLLEKRDVYPRQLSGGQKQRVAIVRSLMMQPEILLLDEITAALDPEMVREVLQVVLELAKEGMTMIVVTHEMEFAKAVADRILFLDKGKIIEESKPQEFFTQPKTERARQFLNTFHYEEGTNI
ncbi:MAG: amino acid ABC transporter ATP-binding protein [Cellulosilyticum sp.]|nr:amino acid ABC transporter ATP-binding protein [Cellulosilyticum sp.]